MNFANLTAIFQRQSLQTFTPNPRGKQGKYERTKTKQTAKMDTGKLFQGDFIAR